MSYEFCTTEAKDHILTVTINRPERMNALHPPANLELGEVFNAFDADPDLWVAIITGAGTGPSAPATTCATRPKGASGAPCPWALGA